MLFRFRTHGSNDCQLIHDRRALWHKLANLNARQFRRYRRERSTGWCSRFWVPSLKLAWSAAQPEQDALLALSSRFLGHRRNRKQSIEAGNRSRTRCHRSLQEQSPMQRMISTAAVVGETGVRESPERQMVGRFLSTGRVYRGHEQRLSEPGRTARRCGTQDRP